MLILPGVTQAVNQGSGTASRAGIPHRRDERFRATRVLNYVQTIAERGLSARQLLTGTGISARRLQSPDYLISRAQYEAVVSNMLALTQDPGIAFSLSGRADLRKMGIVGYAMISAKSLRDASGVWLAYSNSLVGLPVYLETFRPLPRGYEVSVRSTGTIGAIERFEIEDLMLSGLRVIEDLTGVKPRIGALKLAYPAPPHRALYEQTFNCPVSFNASVSLIRIVQPNLNTPVRTNNKEAFTVSIQHCRNILRSIPGSQGIVKQLRSLFLETPGQLPTLQQAATAIGLSRITLRRRLEAQGIGYQVVKDQFRFDLAREYLASGSLSQKQISHLLGFSTPAAFSRAFKHWSGVSAGKFQPPTSEGLRP